MQFSLRIAAAALALILVSTIILYTLAPTILGFVAKASGRTTDFGLSVAIAPEGPVTPNTQVKLSVSAADRLVAMKLTAINGECEANLKIDERKPFSATFTPNETECGEGAYTIRVRGIGVAGNQQIIARTLTVSSLPPPQPTTYSGDMRVSSSNAYPPAPGSSPEQIVIVAPIGPTSKADERYKITGKLAMIKESRGTFDGEYRLVRSDGTVLLTRTVTDPTTLTSDSFETTLEVPGAGSSDTVRLEFRATQQFSAVRVDSWSLTIVRE